jgi:hypothetical protein
MGTLEGAALGLLLASVAWMPARLVARSIRDFFNLRREIARRMSLLGTRRALGAIWMYPRDDPLEMRDPRLDDTERALRELGARMLSFGEAAHPGAWIARLWIVKLMKYDPIKAGIGLIDLSNEFRSRGAGRAIHREAVMDALHIGLARPAGDTSFCRSNISGKSEP